ncbi:MAG TPA: TadE family protein [Terriglobia bacterium]|nr:TadE family protein [Terriglobia bacterium]
MRHLGFEEVSSQVLEFALVIPAIATIFVGTFWIGRVFMVYQNITRAAREGVKYAVLTNCAGCGNSLPDSTDVETNYVNPVLTSGGLIPANVTNYNQVTEWLENSSPQQCGVKISFTYPAQLYVPFTTWNSTINISTSVQMRLENQSSGGTCP